MNEYESEEETHKPVRQPPPYAIGEKVWFTSPSSGRSLEVEFRGWDGDIAVVRTSSGNMRVHLTSLRKLS